MRRTYLMLACLSITFHCFSQRYAIDSFGIQTGDNFTNATHLTADFSTLSFMADTANNGQYRLMQIYNGKTVRKPDFPENYSITSKDFFLAEDGRTYLIKRHPVKGYRIYRYDYMPKEYMEEIPANYPTHFKPLALQGDHTTNVILNDSAGHLQLIYIGLNNIHNYNFYTIGTVGKYKKYNPRFIEYAHDYYLNYITDGNAEVIAKFKRVGTGYQTAYIDTIAYPADTTHLSELIPVYFKIYHSGYDAAHGYELWSKDHYSGVPQRLTDIAPGPRNGVNINTGLSDIGTAYKHKLRICARDSGTRDYTMYNYDIDKDSLSTFHRFKNSTADSLNMATEFINYPGFTNLSNVYFVAHNDSERVLWRYAYFDSTAKAEVVSVGGISKFVNPRDLVSDGLFFYFTAENDGVRKIYMLSDTAVSITDDELPATKVVAFPNPVNNTLHVSISVKETQIFSVALTDISGRLIYMSKQDKYTTGRHTVNIPMEYLPAGTYTYSLINSSGALITSGKAIKH